MLAIGLPGRGKTHFLCALGRELILRHGISVRFVPTFKLVQQLLAAKRDLELGKQLARLDRYGVIILDDIGDVQQSREEMEVLFTFLPNPALPPPNPASNWGIVTVVDQVCPKELKVEDQLTVSGDRSVFVPLRVKSSPSLPPACPAATPPPPQGEWPIGLKDHSYSAASATCSQQLNYPFTLLGLSGKAKICRSATY